MVLSAFDNPKVRVGLAVFGVFALVAVFGPWLVGALGLDPQAVDYQAVARPPGAGHLLGTTTVGQDVFAQLIVGARGSVFVGLASGAIATALAAVIGVFAGFVGGRVDTALNGFTNLFMTLPGFALLFIVAGYVHEAGWLLIAVLIGIFEWPSGARYLRAQAMSLRGRDFTVACRTIGEGRLRLVFVEVMPHLAGIVSAMFLRAVVAGVFAEASLAFLGIGSADTVSWGTMIGYAQQQSAILRGLWWWFAPPGLCIALIGTATALVNFGLDEISNPELRTADRGLLRKLRRRHPLRTTEVPA